MQKCHSKNYINSVHFIRHPCRDSNWGPHPQPRTNFELIPTKRSIGFRTKVFFQIVVVGVIVHYLQSLKRRV